MKIVFGQIASARSYIIQFHPCIQYTFIHVIQISVTEILSLQIKWNVKKKKHQFYSYSALTLTTPVYWMTSGYSDIVTEEMSFTSKFWMIVINLLTFKSVGIIEMVTISKCQTSRHFNCIASFWTLNMVHFRCKPFTHEQSLGKAWAR